MNATPFAGGCRPAWSSGPCGLRRTNVFEVLLEALSEAPCEQLIDLRIPQQPQPFRAASLTALTEGWGILVL